MPVESAADRLVFLSPDEFGDQATYTPSAGGSSPGELEGVFDYPHLSASLQNADVSDARPTFLCRLADLPAGAADGDTGDTLAVRGLTFRVVGREPDGQGMVLLQLGASA